MSSADSRRRTRSQAKALAAVDSGKLPIDVQSTQTLLTETQESTQDIIDLTSSSPPLPSSTSLSVQPAREDSGIEDLPDHLTARHTKLDKEAHALLLKKQTSLKKFATVGILDLDLQRGFHTPLNSTLVFAQFEAGTAVCISPKGFILTCAHCVYSPEDSDGEDDKQTAEERHDSDGVVTDADALVIAQQTEHWLLFASGRAVRAAVVALDTRRDLALLRITASQPRLVPNRFPSISLYTPRKFKGPAQPAVHTPLICIGHPGSEDLEASRPGVATGYNVLHASEGRYRGMCKGQDAEDNSEIGALMHDCWTYWGHSGAPLFERVGGGIVGLHSSWDEETGMRRGIGTKAIRSFLNDEDARRAFQSRGQHGLF